MNTFVLEATEFGEAPQDIYQLLSNDRVLFIRNYIDEKISSDIVATLLLKDSEDPNKKITIFINSEGGNIRSVLSIYDMINLIEAPVETVCIGSAMDEAAILLTSGDKGLRLATKHAIIAVSPLVHDNVSFSNLSDAKKRLELNAQDNKVVMDILSQKTGKSVKEISKDFERRVFMNANQAFKYGLIDKVISFSK